METLVHVAGNKENANGLDGGRRDFASVGKRRSNLLGVGPVSGEAQ